MKKLSEMSFRKFPDEKVEKKLKQYQDVAKKIDEVFCVLGVEKNEDTFIFVKSLIRNNDRGGFFSILGRTLADIGYLFVSKWLPICVTFLLGIFSQKIKESLDISIISVYLAGVVVAIILGYVLDLIISETKKGEKYRIRILDEMTYGLYNAICNIKK